MTERNESRPVAVSAPATPADIVLYAMKNGGSIAEIREFMQLQREWEADQARKAFFDAKAKFHSETIVITKDKDNVQYKSKYTGIGNLVNTVKPFLSKHGLSADWTLDQTSGIKVTCVLTHSLGHSESVAFTVPPDASGAKNAIQQIRSAVTYARSTTFEMVCGLASSDENGDDDGNGFNLDTSLADEWIAKVKAAPTDADVVKVWDVGIVAIEKAKDRNAYKEFKAAVENRRGEFAAAAAKAPK